MKALCAHEVGYKQSLFSGFPTRVSLMPSDTKSLCKKTTDDPNPSEGKRWRLAISGCQIGLALSVYGSWAGRTYYRERVRFFRLELPSSKSVVGGSSAHFKPADEAARP